MSGLYSDYKRVVRRRHAYPDANSHAYAYRYTNANTKPDSDCYGATYPDAKANSGAKTAPYPSATSGLKPLDYQLYERSNEN